MLIQTFAFSEITEQIKSQSSVRGEIMDKIRGNASHLIIEMMMVIYSKFFDYHKNDKTKKLVEKIKYLEKDQKSMTNEMSYLLGNERNLLNKQSE